MINIDKLRPDFMNIFRNNFRGKIHINIPARKLEEYHKHIQSNLYADLEPLEIYTRSIKYKITFDQYEKEFIFYTSVKKSLEKLVQEFQKKIDKVVFDTFVENNEVDRLRKQYQFSILDQNLPPEFTREIHENL